MLFFDQAVKWLMKLGVDGKPEASKHIDYSIIPYPKYLKVRRKTSTAKLPTYESAGAAGMDLYADLNGPVIIGAGDRDCIPTNIAIELPPWLEAQVRSRSGLAYKSGIMVLNSPGTIDSDYRGGIGVILFNTTGTDFIINPGDRIAQLVITPIIRAELVEVDEIAETARGEAGFGSTGVSTIPAAA